MGLTNFGIYRTSQVRAVKPVDARPLVRVIDLVEMLLVENPGLQVILQVGDCQFPVRYVRADMNGVRIGAGENENLFFERNRIMELKELIQELDTIVSDAGLASDDGDLDEARECLRRAKELLEDEFLAE